MSRQQPPGPPPGQQPPGPSPQDLLRAARDGVGRRPRRDHHSLRPLARRRHAAAGSATRGLRTAAVPAARTEEVQGSSEPDASLDAQALVEVYVEAIRDGDCAKIDSMSSEMLNSSTDCDGDIVPPPDMSVEFGDPEMVSDTAATVPMTVDGEESSFTLLLTQEGGEWKVSQIDHGG